jgi:hypothetical protein
MKNRANKHILLCKIEGKGREKDRSRPLEDKKYISNFGRPLKDVFKKRTLHHYCIFALKYHNNFLLNCPLKVSIPCNQNRSESKKFLSPGNPVCRLSQRRRRSRHVCSLVFFSLALSLSVSLSLSSLSFLN